MTSSTRNRLLEAGAELFAERGYRGASVRDLCNLAGANPGAVSYHFDGKRQLYRAVLRQAAERLAGALDDSDRDAAAARAPNDVVRAVIRRLAAAPRAARLLLRDLADGGSVAVETLEPALRAAFEAVNSFLAAGDTPRGTPASRAVFLGLCGPVLTVAAAWPAISRTLQVDNSEAEDLVVAAAELILRGHHDLEANP